MYLAGDVGGTKTNLAVFSPETDLTPQTEGTFRSAEYPSLEAIVAEFISNGHLSVDGAVFGVPGPVVDGRSSATNLPWVLKESTLQEELGLRRVKLLNDLEATAYGVLTLAPGDLVTLNDASPADATMAVIAAGTVLGEAILFYHNGRYEVIPSEGGHADFGPRNLFEIRLLRYMLGKFRHVSYERICSGKGIPYIYAYLKKQGLAEEVPGMAKALRQAEDPTPLIVEKAMSGESELCIAALNAFVSILGAEAGNLALKVMAIGGIYLAGGIPPKILSKLKDGTFMASFVDKGRFADMLARIPVCVVLNDRTALLGAASYGLSL
jgi:glucokinase